jgi:hypothetical protein
MNVATITMPVDEAQQAFEQYRDSLHRRFDGEDAALMRGYKVLAKGKAILNLQEVMKKAGVDHLHRPRLAISRASEKTVFCVRLRDGSAEFRRKRWSERGNFYTTRFPSGTFPECGQNVTLQSVVPPVPPAYRPTFKLSNYHILWEPEWESVPSDPILLRHLSGMLYAVLAQWDLTELERAVLMGRQE